MKNLTFPVKSTSARYLHCIRPYFENIFKILCVMSEKSGNKFQAAPRFNPLLFTISVKSKVAFWRHSEITERLQRCGTVSKRLVRNPVRIVLLTRILLKIKTFLGNFTVSVSEVLQVRQKNCYFLRFHEGSRNMFVNKSEGNQFFLSFYISYPSAFNNLNSVLYILRTPKKYLLMSQTSLPFRLTITWKQKSIVITSFKTSRGIPVSMPE